MCFFIVPISQNDNCLYGVWKVCLTAGSECYYVYIEGKKRKSKL